MLSPPVARRGASPTEDTPFRPPVVILERTLRNEKGASAPLRIGLVALLPPQIDIWERKHLSGQIETRDIVATAEAWVPELKARGADLVILNKFGKQESRGGGFREVIARALDDEIPVLLYVPPEMLADFHAFAGDLAQPVSAASMQDWCLGALDRPAA